MVQLAGGALGKESKWKILEDPFLYVTALDRHYQVRLEVDAYFGNGRLAIQAVDCVDGEPYGTLTCNIPDVFLKNNEILVKTWSENEGLAKAARESGLFRDTGKRVSTGFVQAEVWEVL